MGVSMDPEALGRGANQFASKAEELTGHATSVADLAALRAAFAGAGETVWPLVEARLTELQGRLQAAGEQVTSTGAMLRTASDGFAGTDQDNSRSINSTNPGT
jgi:hypothetical protein